MSAEEKVKILKKMKQGDKIRVTLGDSIIGFYEREMEFWGLNEQLGKARLKYRIKQSRWNPKGRIDSYLLPLTNITI